MRHKLHTSPEPTLAEIAFVTWLVTTDNITGHHIDVILVSRWALEKALLLLNDSYDITSQPTLSLLIHPQEIVLIPRSRRSSRAQFLCEYNSHMIIFMVMTDDAPCHLLYDTLKQAFTGWMDGLCVEMKAKDQLMNLYINRSSAQHKQLFFTAIHCDNTSSLGHIWSARVNT